MLTLWAMPNLLLLVTCGACRICLLFTAAWLIEKDHSLLRWDLAITQFLCQSMSCLGPSANAEAASAPAALIWEVLLLKRNQIICLFESYFLCAAQHQFSSSPLACRSSPTIATPPSEAVQEPPHPVDPFSDLAQRETSDPRQLPPLTFASFFLFHSRS